MYGTTVEAYEWYSISQEDRKAALRQANRRKELRKRASLVIAGLILVLAGIAVLFFGKDSGSAEVEASTVQQKYYTSIEVESGDTLWTLAENYGKRYQDYDVFIDEVRTINQLHGDQITAGANLLIPVYR